MVETKSGIVPLTGANYPTWKVQCKMSLMKDGLWGIVDGSKRAPSTNDSVYSKFCILSLSLEGTVLWQLSSYPLIHLFFM